MKLRDFFEREILISLPDNQTGFHARVKCGGLRFPRQFVSVYQARRPEISSIGSFPFAAPLFDTDSSNEPRSVRSPKNET
jgi:hypothetical protein